MSRVGTPFANASLRTSVCVSCDEGADCQYVSARFSDTGRFYVLACLGPGVPRYTLVDQWTATREYLDTGQSLSDSLDHNKYIPLTNILSLFTISTNNNGHVV